MKPYGEKRSGLRNSGCWIPRIKQWKRLESLAKKEWTPLTRRLGRARARQLLQKYLGIIDL